MARHTRFTELADGRYQREVGEDGKDFQPIGEPFTEEDMRPREEDAYPCGGTHHADCRWVPVGPDGIAIGKCVTGCPVLAEDLERAEALAIEHGWP